MNVRFFYSITALCSVIGGLVLLALAGCGDDRGKSSNREASGGDLSPVESYEEILALKLRDLEQMADLMTSVRDRSGGEQAMDALGRLAGLQKQYERCCKRLIALSPEVQAQSIAQHGEFHAMLRERSEWAETRVMEQLVKWHAARYYDSPSIPADLEKYGLGVTDRRMADYLQSRMLPSLQKYVAQYGVMVDMLEGIDSTTAANAYAASLSLQFCMVRRQADGIIDMERSYSQWLPGLEQYYHGGLSALRVQADNEFKRCFRVLLKLATVHAYDSDSLYRTIVGLQMQHPLLIGFPEYRESPIAAMKEFCLCLERMQTLLKDVKDPKSADRLAMDMMDVMVQLRVLRGSIIEFQDSEQMRQVKTNDLELVSLRAEAAETAISGTMAHLIVETDVVAKSPLLSTALGFYRYIMYQR